LFDAPFHRRPSRVDVIGIVLMVLGFGCMQLFLDLGERRDWLDSGLIVALGVLAVCMLIGFVIRELTASEPILDLNLFRHRNLTTSSLCILLAGFGFNSTLLLLPLHTHP